MADVHDTATRSRNMAAIKGRHTKPELLIRRALHTAGLRYRLHAKHLPGKPDLVFPRHRAVIFVHGCFWHQHPGCREGRLPKSNLAYWLPKLKRNTERDEAALAQLAASGWDVLVLWECETKSLEATRKVLLDFLGPPGVLR